MKREIVRLNLSKDLESFKELNLACFGKNVNLDEKMYKWYFDSNPNNIDNKNAVFLLKEEDRIIACDALFPFELMIKDKKYKAAYSIKSMTHPDYSRQGIFRMMTNNSIKYASEKGIDIVVGLANKASFGAYKKFGWNIHFIRDIYMKVIDIENLLQKRIKIRFLSKFVNKIYRFLNKVKKSEKDFSVVQYDYVPDIIESYWNEFKDEYNAIGIRDFKYLNFRYNGRKELGYKTFLVNDKEKKLGFLILREVLIDGGKRKIISVEEIFSSPFNKEYINFIIKMAIEYCVKVKGEYLVLSTSGYGYYNEEKIKLGFRKIPKKNGYNTFISKILNEDIDFSTIKDSSDWHITQGDGETTLDF